MKTLKDWLKIDVHGEFALRLVNLFIQKTTADEDNELRENNNMETLKTIISVEP